MPTHAGSPLITLDPSAQAVYVNNLSLVDSSSVVLDVSGVALGDFGITRETNTYVYRYTDPSQNQFEFTLVDVIEWDINDHVVYKQVTVSGSPGPFGNEIDAQITAITEIWGDPADDEVVAEIDGYLQKIQSSSVYGMGQLSDYTELLALASDISGVATVELADISGLIQLADAAKQYGDLFYTINQTIEGVTIANNITVLANIRNELAKIAQMYDNLDALKLTISRTSTLKISDDIQSTANKLDVAYSEISKSLDYLKYFVGATGQSASFILANAEMNDYDKATVTAAKGALAVFQNLVVDQQLKLTVNNNTQVANLKDKVDNFQALVSDMASVKTKLQEAMNAVRGISTVTP